MEDQRLRGIYHFNSSVFAYSILSPQKTKIQFFFCSAQSVRTPPRAVAKTNTQEVHLLEAVNGNRVSALYISMSIESPVTVQHTLQQSSGLYDFFSDSHFQDIQLSMKNGGRRL